MVIFALGCLQFDVVHEPGKFFGVVEQLRQQLPLVGVFVPRQDIVVLSVPEIRQNRHVEDLFFHVLQLS